LSIRIKKGREKDENADCGLQDSKAKYQEGGMGNEKESGRMQGRAARAHEDFRAGKLRVQRKMEKKFKKTLLL